MIGKATVECTMPNWMFNNFFDYRKILARLLLLSKRQPTQSRRLHLPKRKLFPATVGQRLRLPHSVGACSDRWSMCPRVSSNLSSS